MSNHQNNLNNSSEFLKKKKEKRKAFKNRIMLNIVVDLWRKHEQPDNSFSFKYNERISSLRDLYIKCFPDINHQEIDSIDSKDDMGLINISPKKNKTPSVLLDVDTQNQLISDAISEIGKHFEHNIILSPNNGSSYSEDEIKKISKDDMVIFRIDYKQLKTEEDVKNKLHELRYLKQCGSHIVYIMENMDYLMEEMQSYNRAIANGGRPFQFPVINNFMEGKKKLYKEISENKFSTSLLPMDWTNKDKIKLEKFFDLYSLDEALLGSKKNKNINEDVFYSIPGGKSYNVIFDEVINDMFSSSFIRRFDQNKTSKAYREFYDYEIENIADKLYKRLGIPGSRELFRTKISVESKIDQFLSDVFKNNTGNSGNSLDKNKDIKLLNDLIFKEKLETFSSSVRRFWYNQSNATEDFIAFHHFNIKIEDSVLNYMDNCSSDSERLNGFKKLFNLSCLLSEESYSSIVWKIASKYPNVDFTSIFNGNLSTDNTTQKITLDALKGKTYKVKKEIKEGQKKEKEKYQYVDFYFSEKSRIERVSKMIKSTREKLEKTRRQKFHKNSPFI